MSTSLTFYIGVIFLLIKLFAQCRLPDFIVSTHLFDKFKVADVADDAKTTWCSKCQEEYPIEDVDSLAFLWLMT